MFKGLESAIRKMIFLEKKILYPTCLRKLNESIWTDIKQGESEIGYAWIKPSALYDLQIVKSTGGYQPSASKSKKEEEFNMSNSIPLSQGQLTVEQIDLMLTNLPVDITVVDENDTVLYYSATKDRIFPRSPAVIGRKVQNCHPPKSVHVVENIIQSFREKKKTDAAFWIKMDEKLIYIRYFPLFDASGNYRGVIEVTQEVSDIQKLEGERRILDW